MGMAKITISVDEDCAKAYQSASQEDKRKMELLFRIFAREITLPSRKSLTQLMDEIGAEAQARGMTPEILEEILNEKAPGGDRHQ
jgi:hypothetical protein